MSMRVFLPLFALSALAADPDGASLFKTKCVSCHDGAENSRAPALDAMKVKSPESVIDTLVNGSMREPSTNCCRRSAEKSWNRTTCCLRNVCAFMGSA